MNRKLETEEEKVQFYYNYYSSFDGIGYIKVLPFYSTSLTPEEEIHIAALQDRRDKDGLTGVMSLSLIYNII